MAAVQPYHLVVDVAVGTPTVTGLWCPTCAAPTGVEYPVLSLSETGVSVIGTARCCTASDDPGQHRVS